jgi:hypothetical protein
MLPCYDCYELSRRSSRSAVEVSLPRRKKRPLAKEAHSDDDLVIF